MSVRLDIQANSATELLRKLRRIDIAVPPMDDGARSTSHREQYMIARMLATLALDDSLQFPLRVAHREKPDFALYGPADVVGVECVEATHPEWVTIQAIRGKDFPDALIFVPMLRPGERKFSTEERVQIARGDRAGPPWLGNMAERQWAAGIAHFIKQKTEKLRKGNYSEFRSVWLLVQDEWPAPVHYPEEYAEAAALCVAAIAPYTTAPCFSRILVGNSRWLITLFPGPVAVEPMNDLWE